jgi:purine-cytosine permease-like protein
MPLCFVSWPEPWLQYRQLLLAFRLMWKCLPLVICILQVWVGYVTVFAVGAVITMFAILGFEKLARFSKVAAPWMFFIFVAAAISSFPRLGVQTDLSNFWEVAREKIWTGTSIARTVAVYHLACYLFYLVCQCCHAPGYE